MPDTFTCGRRHDGFAYQGDVESADTWRPDGTCSYCGSISPEAFFAAVEAGHEVGPTDKNYKAYIDVADPQYGELKVVSLAGGGKPSRGEGWVPVTDDLRATYSIEPVWKWVTLAPRDTTKRAKFYFQHLDEDGRRRFIELLNERKMNVGYPGHFYRLPYFARHDPA